MKRIVVLIHRTHRFDGLNYVLHAVAERWRQDGLEVVVLQGPEDGVDADLAVLHVDLTIVPDDYLSFLRRYPVVVNGRVTDISKRRLSDRLLRPGDGFDGPVIVKANLNAGGWREAQLARQGLLPERFKVRVGEYAVLESSAEVPPEVWAHPALVVEKFVPELRGDLFCLRTWMFLGDRETHSICWSKNPVVKSSNLLGRESLPGAPDDLRALRKELGFDFGKFDYVVVDGKSVLYDANRTPTVGSLTPEEKLQRVEVLADGLRSFAGSR